MDVLKRSHRFSYAAAFGTLARLCADIVFNSKYAFTYTGPTYIKGLYLCIFTNIKFSKHGLLWEFISLMNAM